jgi:hypothetical protein
MGIQVIVTKGNGEQVAGTVHESFVTPDRRFIHSDVHFVPVVCFDIGMNVRRFYRSQIVVRKGA